MAFTRASWAAILAATSHLAAAAAATVRDAKLPPQAQVIDQRNLNVMPTVPTATEYNGSDVYIPYGYTLETLKSRPFHVYDDDFYAILGSNPTLSLIAKSESDPLYHEAAVWHKSTDEIFFSQNAGSSAAGTGLNKSAIIQKVSMSAVAAAAANGSFVHVEMVDMSPQVINPNGGTNFNGKLLFAGQGQGDNIPPALYVVDPQPPYNTKMILNNFYGRQFSSLNDLSVHPKNGDVYFVDTEYAYLQYFRPAPGLRNQVYRFNAKTGAVTVAADGFVIPNGFGFSPDGKHAYVTDTGRAHASGGTVLTDPSTIYRYDVLSDGTFENRKVFAFASNGIPDGIHFDTKGNVYVGVGDGVHVWNPSGKLLGKIFLGTTSANFNFAGSGRMVICAETELYYVTLAATGAYANAEM